jgi:hypothetical protein
LATEQIERFCEEWREACCLPVQRPLSSEEIELDVLGVLTYRRGNIVRRLGKNWKVKSTELEPETADVGKLRVLRVNLVDGREASIIRTSTVSAH